MNTPIMIIRENFQSEVIQSDMPVLLYCYADWSGPCIKFSPIINDLSQKHSDKIKICEVNLNEKDNQYLANLLNVIAIPTILFFVNGVCTGKLIGSKSRNELLENINKYCGVNIDIFTIQNTIHSPQNYTSPYYPPPRNQKATLLPPSPLLLIASLIGLLVILFLILNFNSGSKSSVAPVETYYNTSAVAGRYAIYGPESTVPEIEHNASQFITYISVYNAGFFDAYLGGENGRQEIKSHIRFERNPSSLVYESSYKNPDFDFDPDKIILDFNTGHYTLKSTYEGEDMILQYRMVKQ